ncbi:hypothetical protein [Thiomonas sp. FB-6]|uniref:hypothetical protein n=1 Tax=Thiomonas sp. FB-6 TaxID=1158291 RepID=UPI0012DCC94D|nr:hypothetical protein [Thiomonas sp. FB-6]
MSKAVCHGGQIYLCGQTSAGSEAVGIAAQTQEVLARVDALLQAQGSDRSRLLAVTVCADAILSHRADPIVSQGWEPV